MCGFTAQLVEHCTGIAEVTGSNPVETLIFFQASSSSYSSRVDEIGDNVVTAKFSAYWRKKFRVIDVPFLFNVP